MLMKTSWIIISINGRRCCATWATITRPRKGSSVKTTMPFKRAVNKPFVQEGGAQLPLGSVATRSNLLKIYEKRIGQENGALSVLDELIENSSIYSQIIGINREDMD